MREREREELGVGWVGGWVGDGGRDKKQRVHTGTHSAVCVSIYLLPSSLSPTPCMYLCIGILHFPSLFCLLSLYTFITPPISHRSNGSPHFSSIICPFFLSFFYNPPHPPPTPTPLLSFFIYLFSIYLFLFLFLSPYYINVPSSFLEKND